MTILAFAAGVATTTNSTIAVGQTQTVLYSFAGGADGAYPYAGLTADGNGNFFGTTSQGGTGKCGSGGNAGCGAVFELSPASSGGWTEKVLYSFTNSPDGADPMAGVVLDGKGNLYGTTAAGGFVSGFCNSGCGTIFQLSPSAAGTWKETVLYKFHGFPIGDGALPYAGLIFDSVGNLYGTTGDDGSESLGSVFELSPKSSGGWMLFTLARFKGANGQGPVGGVIFDSKGNLYGTTAEGGANSNLDGSEGTVFELSPQGNGGWIERVLYSFGSKPNDGYNPRAGLAMDNSGHMFGTTFNTDAGANGGSVFEVALAQGQWKEWIVHNFPSQVGYDGLSPTAGVTFDSAGNLYGTTGQGGRDERGTVFKLTNTGGGNWSENTLPYSFTGGSDGSQPAAGVILDAAGNIYGTTVSGGQNGFGVVFEITP